MIFIKRGDAMQCLKVMTKNIVQSPTRGDELSPAPESDEMKALLPAEPHVETRIIDPAKITEKM